jgi:hypothetical protein
MITQEPQISFEVLKEKTVGDLQAMEDSDLLKTNFNIVVKETRKEKFPTAEEIVGELV